MNQHTKQLQLHVEDLLLLMNASDIASAPFREGGYRIPLRAFDKAQPFILRDVTHSDFADEELFTDVSLRDLASPLDVTVMVRDKEDGRAGVHRLAVVRRPLFPVKRPTRYVVAHRMLFLDPRSGAGKTFLTYYGSNTGDARTWIDLNSGIPLSETHRGRHEVMSVALGLHFNHDYIWHVHLKWPGAEAGVMVPTTPEGARTLFRLRDYDPGASRRKALIHWVSEHSRRIRKDTIEETRVWVREHTRGTAKFKWQDMEGAIYPAAYDLRRLEQAKGGNR